MSDPSAQLPPVVSRPAASSPPPATAPLRRLYARIPLGIRDRVRWMKHPVRSALAQYVRWRARHRIASGPFEGLRFPVSPYDRHHLAYWLGTQEMELATVVERIVRTGCRTVLNVGSAEGYYASGLAARMPQARVVAFEGDERKHPYFWRMARANDVASRLTLRGFCTRQQFADALRASSGPVVVVMDIEGGELGLLDPTSIPELRGAAIFVETHDVFAAGCTDTLVERFGATHAIERIASRPRTLADVPRRFRHAARLFPRSFLTLLDEQRAGSQEWLYMTPR